MLEWMMNAKGPSHTPPGVLAWLHSHSEMCYIKSPNHPQILWRPAEALRYQWHTWTQHISMNRVCRGDPPHPSWSVGPAPYLLRNVSYEISKPSSNTVEACRRIELLMAYMDKTHWDEWCMPRAPTTSLPDCWSCSILTQKCTISNLQTILQYCGGWQKNWDTLQPSAHPSNINV